jgi:NADP-dependent 3-hydroxy acid dehydrogenase YdfG
MHDWLNERGRSWVRMGSRERPFEGRIALVTGGGTGVGAAIALALAQEGAALHLLGRRPQQLEAIASAAHRMGVAATCHRADLSLASEQPALVRQLGQDLPQLDFLIQNAAAHNTGPIEYGNAAELDALYHTNVRAPYLLSQSLLPKLKARRGQIVFINSSGALTAKPMSAQYDATKHALKAIADSLRGEVNQHGVRVLSVYLGRTATDMQAQIHEREGKKYHPELLLQPADVASVIVSALRLPRTAEVTDIHIRPMIKS